MNFKVLLERLWARRLVRAMLAILLALYAAAIYAPLIANDRPYYLKGIDYGAYERARKTLVPIARELERLLSAGQPDREAAARELAALEERVDALARWLPAGEQPELARFAQACRHAMDGGAGPGEQAFMGGLAAQAEELRNSLAPRRSGTDEGQGVELRSRRSFPLLSSLGAFEVFWMVLWVFALVAFLPRRLVPRLVLERPAGLAAIALGASAAAALLAWIAFPQTRRLAPLSEKSSLTRGEIAAETALLPPLFYGFSETQLAEKFRPPTWVGAAAMDAEGRYVNRSTRPDATGFEPPPAPVEVRYGEPALNSPWRHCLGADGSGRDVLVRILWGARVSLTLGIAAAVLLVLLGTAVGMLAGYFGGSCDLLLSRLIEIVMSIPAFFLIIMAAAFTDPRELSPALAIVLLIALVRWSGIARLARAECLRLRELEFVLASRALGASSARTILCHVLPNAVGPILVAGAFAVAAAILTESAISFLGFGVVEPVPSWGALINESKSASHWWVQVFPGLLIFFTVTCFNLFGEGIRDALDPRGRAR